MTGDEAGLAIDPGAPAGRARRPTWARALLLGIAYLLTAYAGAALSGTTAFVSLWFPGGIYVAALLMTERSEWPWMVAGACVGGAVFDVAHGTPLTLIPWFLVANSVMATSAAYATRRLLGGGAMLDTVNRFVVLLVVTAIGSPILSATIGTLGLAEHGLVPSFGAAWWRWWGSNAIAIVLVVPFVLAWLVEPMPGSSTERRNTSRLIEAVLLFGGLTFATWYLMIVDNGITAPYKSRLLPFMLWAGLRFGVRGATAASLLLCLLMTYLAVTFARGLSPADVQAGAWVFTLQTFLANAVLVALLPAVVLAERDTTLADLQATQNRFRTLNDAAFEGVSISENGRLLDANDQLLRMFGYRRDEMVGHRVLEFVTPESHDLAETVIREARESAFELILLRKDGTRFPAEVRARHVEIGRGRQVRMAAIRDVTARKGAERALTNSEALLRQFIKHAPAAIAMLDRDLRYLQASDRWLIDYHLVGQDIVGRHHYEVFPDIPERWREIHRRVLAGAAERCDEDPFPRADGGMEWLQWEALPWRKADGEIGGLIFFTQVITERKNMEEALRASEARLLQAQKLEAIGTLAGGIAHDFNNIISAIIGNVTLAQLDLDAAGASRGAGADPVAPSTEDMLKGARGSLDEIGRAARRAKELTRQILTFSRRQDTAKRLTHLADPVNEVVSLLRSTLPAGVVLDVSIAPDTPPVMGDPTQVHQILMNLCTNAWHAMDGSAGRITIELAAITIPPASPNDLAPRPAGVLPGRWARLRVVDDGQGMDAATLARIFEPFFTTKAPGRGTGLGLAVVHGIVKEHQAVIDVVSQPGQGATFDIWFPAAEEVTRADSAGARQLLPTQGGGRRILYLDDEEPLVKLTERLLGRLGYRVTGLTRPDEALDLLARRAADFDLLLTDYNMPGLSGLQVAKAVASIRPDLPVMMVSGFVSEELRAEAERAGIKHVVYKPDTVDEMCSAIHELVQAG